MNAGALINRVRARKRTEEIERDLPFALMHLRTRLALGERFDSALLAASKSVKGALGSELEGIALEIKDRGASVEEAFLHSLERVPSLQFKRACSQLVSLHEQGFSHNELSSLKSLHREFLAWQRAKIKEFSGKMVVFSLMFVAFSTVMPALFLAFILIGSMFLELEISPSLALTIVIVFFPLADIAILLYIREKTPLFARS